MLDVALHALVLNHVFQDVLALGPLFGLLIVLVALQLVLEAGELGFGPFFFVNGHKFEVLHSFDQLPSVIVELLDVFDGIVVYLGNVAVNHGLFRKKIQHVTFLDFNHHKAESRLSFHLSRPLLALI